MMRMFNYLSQLIKVNSGHSSKAFFLVSVSVTGCFLLLVVAFVLVWEVVTTNTIKTDLMGLSAFVGSITTLFTAAGGIKAYSEKNETKRNIEESEV